MDPVTIALLLGGAILLRPKKKGKRSGKVTYGRGMTHAERSAMLAEVRKMSYYVSNKYGMMPYLADYLTTIGYIESRFNPTSVNPEIKTNPANAARGLFGMRPETAFGRRGSNLKHLVKKPNLLLNPKWAFVTAVDYALQADQRSIDESGREADWAAVRRWWGRPKLVHDYDLSDSRSQASMRKFTNGIEDVNREYGVNINEDFIWMNVERGGYPGIQSLMKDFGLKG